MPYFCHDSVNWQVPIAAHWIIAEKTIIIEKVCTNQIKQNANAPFASNELTTGQSVYSVSNSGRVCCFAPLFDLLLHIMTVASNWVTRDRFSRKGEALCFCMMRCPSAMRITRKSEKLDASTLWRVAMNFRCTRPSDPDCKGARAIVVYKSKAMHDSGRQPIRPIRNLTAQSEWEQTDARKS